MLSRLRVLGPASVAMLASVLVWIQVLAADPLDGLYPLNMATRASTSAYLFIGAAAGAFAAVETGLSRRHTSARLVEIAAARRPVLVVLRRLAPVVGWFSGAVIAVISGAAIVGDGPAPTGQIAAVTTAAVASVWLAIGTGAVAGRYLPLGLGPLAGTVSTYAVYIPAILFGGGGPWAVVPVMDVHPAPHSVVRVGAYLLGAALLIAGSALLISLSGPRLGSPLLPAAAVVVALAAAIPLARASPRSQEAVFLERSDQASVCTVDDGTRLCLLEIDARFLGTLQEGTSIAAPVLQKYSLEPDLITQVDGPGPRDGRVAEVAVTTLNAGPRATAAAIIDAATISIASRCDFPTMNVDAPLPWDVIIGAVLREEAGLPGDEFGGEFARQFSTESLTTSQREQRLRDVIAAMRACRPEYP